MNNEDIKKIAMRQSAIDLNCKPEDFENQGDKVVLSKLNAGAKSATNRKCFVDSLIMGMDWLRQ